MISNSCGNGVGADAAMMLCRHDIHIRIIIVLLLMHIRVEFACFEAMAGVVRSVMIMASVSGRYW